MALDPPYIGLFVAINGCYPLSTRKVVAINISIRHGDCVISSLCCRSVPVQSFGFVPVQTLGGNIGPMSHLLVGCVLLSAFSLRFRAQRLIPRKGGVVPSTAKRHESANDLTGLSYTVDRTGTDPVAVLIGEIDLASIGALEAAIDATEQDAAAGADVVLDMTGVTFLDSSGLRVLVTANDRLASAGSRLVIRRPAASVLRVLEITGLLSTITVDD